MSFENALKIVGELANDFKANEEHFLNPSYSEADVRNDFINKFFIALGWDVRHETQKNPYEQEVRVEKAVQIAKAQKRADYSFAITPNFRTVKFFVEAKKPSHGLENKDYYFQTARYGWNASTPIAVLTDFEEFHIIDCRFRPDINDALNYKIEQFRYTDYSDKEKFAKIYYLFSRESVIDNSIEKYVDALPKLRGKKAKAVKAVLQSIDESFLEELDEIRNDLAKSFKKNNSHLSSEELTEATQRTIDRLVFIKFLEDKLIEPDHYVSEFGGRKKAWEDFLTASRTLDAKYNGVVFKKSKIDSRNLIEPDDKTFSAICDELSHENTPYNFDAIPIHILGSIYERFLGKVVHATDKRVTIEEKPEVRKAGGVYYTPQYIVNYIVDNTVGKLIDGKTPKEIAKLRFADIACGSGSFLITVFERLLDYHKRWYINNPEQAKKDGCILLEGTYHLSLKQKTKILLNNVYGVDIDQQAVEVTQLSLYLKLLEDETTATANDSWVMFKEQLLPDLNKNIVCGNSLIGTDILNPSFVLPFAKGEETGGVGGVDELKLKPMDFETIFPHIFSSKANGPVRRSPKDEDGFDVIVGNPPYVRIQVLTEFSPETVKYLAEKYQSALKGNYDLYVTFIERGLTLISKNGFVGMILPNKFFNSEYGRPIREIINRDKRLEEIINFGANQVFKGATTYTCILILSGTSRSSMSYLKINNLDEFEKESTTKKYQIKNIKEYPDNWNFVVGENLKVFEKIKSDNQDLGVLADIFVGLQTSADSVFILSKIKELPDSIILFSKELNEEIEIEKSLLYPLLSGTDVKRYDTPNDRQYLLFPYHVKDEVATLYDFNLIKRQFPKAAEYLLRNRKSLENRERGKFKDSQWYRFGRNQNLGIQNKVKLCIPRLVQRIQVIFDSKGKYFLDNVDVGGLVFKPQFKHFDLRILLVLLNSKLLSWYFSFISAPFRGDWRSANRQFLSKIPIVPIQDFTEDQMKNILNLSDQILIAKNQLQQAKTESDKTYLERKCEILDKQIDELVYHLYGLTEEEIKIVEDNVK